MKLSEVVGAMGYSKASASGIRRASGRLTWQLGRRWQDLFMRTTPRCSTVSRWSVSARCWSRYLVVRPTTRGGDLTTILNAACDPSDPQINDDFLGRDPSLDKYRVVRIVRLDMLAKVFYCIDDYSLGGSHYDRVLTGALCWPRP